MKSFGVEHIKGRIQRDFRHEMPNHRVPSLSDIGYDCGVETTTESETFDRLERIGIYVCVLRASANHMPARASRKRPNRPKGIRTFLKNPNAMQRGKRHPMATLPLPPSQNRGS